MFVWRHHHPRQAALSSSQKSSFLATAELYRPASPPLWRGSPPDGERMSFCDHAQALAERLHARRGVLRGEIKPVCIPPGRPSIFPPRRLQRASQRPVAIARRRGLAASGPMPPVLACKFTVSELEVLRIIGDEVRQHGQCARCVDEIAARAGVCRQMVQNALREASWLGLLTIEERRREGRRNLPNVVRIVAKE